MSRSTPPELEQLASTYPGVLVIFKGDASKDGDNQAAVEGAMQAFGRLDSLICASKLSGSSSFELTCVAK